MAHDGSFLGHFDVPAWLSCDGSVQFDTFHHPAVDAGLEAALSSALLQGSPVVSRPSHSATAGDVGVVMGELVGQLGLVACDGGASSPYASCYSTPAGSPAAKRALPPPFAGDPGFADRAARLSCFGAGLSRVASSQSLPTEAPGAPVAAQAASCGSSGDSHGRKRKPSAKAKGTTTNVKMPDVETSAKKCKLDVDGGERDEETKPIAEHGETGQGKGKESNGKPVEPPKDYIHVRARRGQATDSHSLAERVRREKISERMKLLQDLVPGCNKVTGKAVMLDEIINYVQSLQRQVEFLSMKLATVNPRLDFNVDNFLPKDVQQPCASIPPPAYSFEASSSPFSYASQSQGTPMHSALTNANDKDTSGLHRSLGMSHPPIDAFASANPQIESLWEDDLQSVVQMGFRGT